MSFAFERIVNEPHHNMITPHFRYDTVEDVPASQREKRPIMRTIEVCEIRIAGEKNYVPVVPVDTIWKTIDDRPITYAERFSDQYRQFKSGLTQEASGTPLEQLTPFGISPAQISLCRAMRIYSIEAIGSLEGQNLKALGAQGNDLKRMAEAYMADRAGGVGAAREMDALRRRIAELEAAQADHTNAVVESVSFDQDASSENHPFAGFSDDDLKQYLREKTGAAPRGQPSRATLLRMAEEA